MKMLRKHIQNIVWLCKPFWKYGKVYIISSICILGLYAPIDDVIYVRFPEVIINLLSARKSFPFIAVIAAIICGISFLNNAIQKISRAYFTKRQAEFGMKANWDIYKKAMGLDYKYIDNPAYYNNYAWAIGEYAEQLNQGRDFLVSLSQCILSLVALGAIVATLGPWILLVEVIQMVLHTIVNRRVNIYTIKQKEAAVPLDRRLNYFHRLFYMKDYAADMKSTPLSESVFTEYSKVGKQKIQVIRSFAWKIEFWNVVHEIIFCLTELVIALYLVQSIISGRIPEVGMYMTLMLSFYRLDSKIDILTGLLKDAGILSMNAEKIRAFFEINAEIETAVDQIGIVPNGDNFSVELRNVSFSYENSEFSLSGLNLFIRPGEKIAIVGENGAGKSTFVKLLLRLYDVDDGDIYINGKPIQEYDVHLLRQKIGVAFQNTNIYAMSLFDNISLYGDVTKTALYETAKMLGLDEIIEKNKTDYQAELTREFYENGILLSGGEAQKIGLARVMSRNFSLLLLDEPSSALDPLAEYKMSQEILRAANKTTTIIIAHRLSTIRDVDRIVVFDHGRICEIGSHDELISLNGKYKEMFTKQAENYVR